MEKRYTKKGQVQGTVGMIISLIVGVGVSVMVLIFVGALGGQTYNLVEEDIDAIGNHSVTEAALVADNVTAQAIGNHDIHVGSVLFNNSAFTVSNFTIDYDAGTFLYLDVPGMNGTDLLVNYSWGQFEVADSVRAGITSSFEALENTGDYLPIIVLAVVISMVLFLVLGFTNFGMGGGKGTVL